VQVSRPIVILMEHEQYHLNTRMSNVLFNQMHNIKRQTKQSSMPSLRSTYFSKACMQEKQSAMHY